MHCVSSLGIGHVRTEYIPKSASFLIYFNPLRIIIRQWKGENWNISPNPPTSKFLAMHCLSVFGYRHVKNRTYVLVHLLCTFQPTLYPHWATGTGTIEKTSWLCLIPSELPSIAYQHWEMGTGRTEHTSSSVPFHLYLNQLHTSLGKWELWKLKKPPKSASSLSYYKLLRINVRQWEWENWIFLQVRSIPLT